VTRLVGVVAAVSVVAGLLWREAVAMGALRPSPAGRRVVDVALVFLVVVFAASAAATVAEML